MKPIIAQGNLTPLPPLTLAGSVHGLMNINGIDSDDAGGSFFNSQLPGVRRYVWPVMKNILRSIGAASFIAAWCAASLPAAETNTNTTPTRIGTYDSRAVAYAWFCSARHQTQLNEMMQTARAAKSAGDTNRFKEFDAALRQLQDEMHREVFSTAPATNALAGIQARLPEIQQAAGVSALISKWDDAALKKYPDAKKVDVTAPLVREFIVPTPQQQKVLSDMQRQKPLPLEQCEELIRKGEI
jgi:hypothetical protein